MDHDHDDRSERDWYKKPGGGLIDPQGEPKRDGGQGEAAPKDVPNEHRDIQQKDVVHRDKFPIEQSEGPGQAAVEKDTGGPIHPKPQG